MATLNAFQSDVILGGVGSSDLGYNVDEVTVTYTAGMRMGAALSVVGGKYVWTTIATVASCVGILIDPKAEGYVADLPAGDHTLVVAKRGSTINLNKITLADSTDVANILLAGQAFEAAGANKVTDKVFG